MTRLQQHSGALPRGDSKPAFVFALIFVALATGIVIAGYFYYRHNERQFRTEAEHQLLAIAELKVGELVQWRKERLADANIWFNNANISALVRRFLEKPADADAQRQLQGWFDKYGAHFRYDQVRLLDAQGVNRLSSPAGLPAVSTALAQSVSEALQSGQIVLQDFYRSGNDRKIRLGLVVPILYEADRNRPLGVIVLQIDPAGYLYPFIQRWPMPGRTGETLLLRRDGNDILYLNELRQRKNTALALRIPMTRTDVPAVKVVLGQTGIVPGVDYRGVPVLAAAQVVPGSPWFIIAKIDFAEVNAPMRERLRQMVVLLVALLLAAGAGVWMVWRQQRFRFYRERAQITESLRRSEEKFSRAFQTSSYAITITHAEDGRFIEVNDAFTSIAGYTREEALADSSIGLKMWVNEAERQRVVDDLRAGKAVNGREYRFRTKNGKEIIGLFSAQIIRLSQGTCILSSINDITERKKAEQSLIQSRRAALNMMSDAVAARDQAVLMSTALRDSEQKFRDTIKYLDEGYYSCTAEGLLLEHNLAFNRILGFDPALDMKGKKLPDFWQNPGDRKEYLDELMTKGFVGNYLINVKKSGGEKIAVLASAHLIKDEKGRLVKIVGTFTDFTERKMAEEKILQLNEQLVQKARDLEQIIYVTSHDLRSPLVNVQGFSKELSRSILSLTESVHSGDISPEALRKIGPILKTEIPESIGFIQSSITQMDIQLSALLKLSRLGRAVINTEKIDMNTTVAEIVKSMEYVVKQKEVRIEVAELPPCTGDMAQTNQIFLNLIGNAVKYLDPKRPGSIRISGRIQDAFAVYCIEDNGIGIAREYQTKIFEIFYRIEDVKHSGEGLGLTIARQSAEKQNGTVWVESEPGKGSRFFVKLPGETGGRESGIGDRQNKNNLNRG